MLPFKHALSGRINFSALLFGMLVAVAGLHWMACGGSKLRANMTTEERMNHAMRLFEKRDYLDARTEFRIITLNAPGSAFVDKAQFYLAECHYHIEEFIVAAAEYEKVLRLYPRSEYLDDAQYKIAMSYFRLSPKAALDQTYTARAVAEFQKFLEDYPGSDLKQEATKMLFDLRSKLAKKEFDGAELYRRMSYYEAALVYYNEVLNRYYDTVYAEPALYYKAEILFELLRYAEAKEALYQLLDRYRREGLKQEAAQGRATAGKFQGRAENLLKNIEAELGVNGKAQK